MRRLSDPISKNELEKVELELADLCAEENVRFIKDELKDFYCDEGGVHPGKLWSLRKKLFPNYREPPVAMKDSYGNLIMSLSGIEQLAIETYKSRLKNRPMIPELESLKSEK